MRIGIKAVDSRASGGNYHYCLTLLEALRSIGTGDDFVVFHAPVTDLPLARLRDWSIKVVCMDFMNRKSIFKRLSRSLRTLLGDERLRRAKHRLWRHVSISPPSASFAGEIDTIHQNPRLTRWFEPYGIELMIYPSPSEWSFELGIPYVMSVPDLMHRLLPEFPEGFAHGDFQFVEYMYRNGIRCATLILADSEVGKEDILKFYGPYGVTADTIRILPFLPPNYLRLEVTAAEKERVLRRYDLPDNYLFYPAQFWPHKNHLRIIQALSLLKAAHSLEITLVLTGFNTGGPETAIRETTFRQVCVLANRVGVERQVRYLGYVPDEDMGGLYAGAAGLIMPTLCGPTNIPVVEAWAIGCPVITSDIRGIREHAGDAAILVNPRSPEAIADGIYRLWTDGSLRTALVQRGGQRLASYTPEDYRQRLSDILVEAKRRVRNQRGQE